MTAALAPVRGRLATVHRIAVLRANAIGDMVFALPALEALRAAYPLAEIVLLGQPWHHAFWQGRPGPVDRVEVVPLAHGIREQPGREPDPDALDRFFEAMAAERFDLAIQMHGGGRNSNPFVLRLGARVTAGLRTADAPLLDRWLPYHYFQSEVHRYLEVMALVGAPPVTLESRIQLLPGDLEEAQQVVPPTEQPIAVLHPGAGDPRRRWPPPKFAAVGDALAAAGARVAVIGSGPERPLVEAVVQAMGAPAQDLCDRLSLRGLAGLLFRSAVVVSNDSGPVHLAEAVGTPTVGIYWCGNVINAAPLTRERHRLAISWRLECPACGVNCIDGACPHQVSFVADVPVDEVRGQALDLFSAVI